MNIDRSNGCKSSDKHNRRRLHSSSVLIFFLSCSIFWSRTSFSSFLRRSVSVPKLGLFSVSSSWFSRTSEYSSWFVIPMNAGHKTKIKHQIGKQPTNMVLHYATASLNFLVFILLRKKERKKKRKKERKKEKKKERKKKRKKERKERKQQQIYRTPPLFFALVAWINDKLVVFAPLLRFLRGDCLQYSSWNIERDPDGILLEFLKDLSKDPRRNSGRVSPKDPLRILAEILKMKFLIRVFNDPKEFFWVLFGGPFKSAK